jgi:hypothetical protein
MSTRVMNNLKISPLLLLTLALFTFSNDTFADIYRWRDSKGVMQYSDRPPPAITRKHSEDILLKIIKDQDLCAAPSKTSVKKFDPIILNGFFGAATLKLTSQASTTTSTAPTTTTTSTAPTTTTTSTAPTTTTTSTAPTTTTTSTSSTKKIRKNNGFFGFQTINSSSTTSTPTGVDVVATTTTGSTTTGSTTTGSTTTGSTTTGSTTTGSTTTGSTTTGSTTTGSTTTGSTTTGSTTTGSTTTGSTTTGSTTVSMEPPPHATWCEGSCSLPQGVTAKVWYGVAQTHWVTKDKLTGTFSCGDTTFGSNAGTTAYKRCAWVDMATLGALNPNGQNLMPYVNMANLPKPFTGFSTLNLLSAPVIPSRDPSSNGGEFRIRCKISHFAKDDPIVYPNVPGAAHLHAFFGNAGINAYSTNESLRTTGNSTCSGGIANRSGYWVPALIDTTTGLPAPVSDVITYYKSDNNPATTTNYTTAPPKGLRMIAGNQKPLSIADSSAHFLCMDSQQAMNPANWGVIWEGDHIQQCGDGTNRYSLRFKVEFPECWDGKNLDSPDHQSHMAYACKYGQCELANGSLGATANGCPITHPVLIPTVTINANFTNLSNHLYRLSSDNYSTKYPGGYSLHADWMNGWDETIMDRIIKGCMLGHKNCETDDLGDGQSLKPYDS